VEITDASSAEDATAKAWKVYKPDANRTPKLTTPSPARDGWEEMANLSYETSPNEKVFVAALAQRSGQTWTILIADGAEATFEKRSAAIGLIAESVRPKGFSKENFVGRTAQPLDDARIGQLNEFVTTTMKEMQIPGAAVALIDHGKIVYEGGFGVRELGKPEPVDAHTLFMIASNTKSMSTLLLAEEVDAGKVRWDQKVTEVYPSFRLGNAEVTDKVLIKHLVCACTGLPRKDFEWLFNTTPQTPASATFTQLAATMPTSGFGEVFQYNNLMASAAGYVAAHLVYPDMEIGAAYNKAMQEKVFNPLGMTDTTFDYKRVLAGNYAHPYGYDINAKAGVIPMAPNYTIIPYRPAGGAWSSAHDMILYVQNELTKGVLPNGKRLISEENLLERRKPNVPTGEKSYYGMGLETDTTYGVEVVHHGGSMFGYKSDIILIPEAGIGAVILTSLDEARPVIAGFRRRLLEVVYDGKPEAAEDMASAAKAMQASYLEERSKLQLPSAVTDLANSYSNPELGFLKVRMENGQTFIDVPSWSSEVASRKNEDGTLSLSTSTPGLTGFIFVIGVKDGKKTLTTRDSQHEYVYTEN
jgi:CubicO group peptidase (beta-lactamase class C family)